MIRSRPRGGFRVFAVRDSASAHRNQIPNCQPLPAEGLGCSRFINLEMPMSNPSSTDSTRSTLAPAKHNAFDDVLLSRRELADAFRVTPRTVYEWERTGRIPAPQRTPSGRPRWRKSSVAAMLKAPA